MTSEVCQYQMHAALIFFYFVNRRKRQNRYT